MNEHWRRKNGSIDHDAYMKDYRERNKPDMVFPVVWLSCLIALITVGVATA